MHVALVRQRYSAHGGAERFIERALDALSEQGVAVTVLPEGFWKNRGLTMRQSLMSRPRPLPELPALEPKPPQRRAGSEFHGGAGITPRNELDRFFPHRGQ